MKKIDIYYTIKITKSAIYMNKIPGPTHRLATLTSFASLRHSNPFCGSFGEIVVFSNYFQWFSLAEGVGFEPTGDFHHA